MGKSTVAARLRAHGVAVFDADKAVHELYRGDVVDEVEAAFPGVSVGGQIDRKLLSQALKCEDPEQTRANFAKLEAIVHPKVREMERAFLQDCMIQGDDLAVLEIPLFFEAGMEGLVDYTVVVVAPKEIRDARVLASRPDMSKEKLDALVAKQMPDDEKCNRADYIIDTGGSLKETEQQVDELIDVLQKQAREVEASDIMRKWGLG